MSVREAAERLRRVALIPEGTNAAFEAALWDIYQSEGYSGLERDERELAYAYLAELDETPVDDAWLRSHCCREGDPPHYFHLIDDEERWVFVYARKWEGGHCLNIGSATVSRHATKGQVLTLLRVLGGEEP